MIQINTNIFPETKGAYLVGGSIRDLLLGRSPIDYDIAVLGNPEKFAKKIAAKISGHIVRLGKPGQAIIRVVSDNKIFDISSVNGATIEDDLSKRDFTINAIACSLSSKKIIDCLGGIDDIAANKIRMVSRKAFRKDPIRLIRAYRMGASLNFEIEPHTSSAIKNDANLIQDSAGERIRTELFKIFNTSKSHRYISQMANTGLLFSVFPELNELKGCPQNIYHSYDVFEHTMKAFYHLEALLNDCGKAMPAISDPNILNVGHQAAWLKCAILLHDIGKPHVKTVDSKNNIHFYGHGQKSADMAKAITTRLKFSNRERLYIDHIIRNHIRPLFLFTAYQKKTLTNKGIIRFFNKCGDNTPALLLHAIADIQGKWNKGNARDKDFISFAKKMIQDYISVFKPEKKLPPLLTGYDLMTEFGLTPSPLFKKILNNVEEARLCKTIKSRQDALILAKKIIK